MPGRKKSGFGMDEDTAQFIASLENHTKKILTKQAKKEQEQAKRAHQLLIRQKAGIKRKVPDETKDDRVHAWSSSKPRSNSIDSKNASGKLVPIKNASQYSIKLMQSPLMMSVPKSMRPGKKNRGGGLQHTCGKGGRAEHEMARQAMVGIDPGLRDKSVLAIDPNLQLQGPTNWKSHDLRLKYRDESGRTAAWQSSLKSQSEAKALEEFKGIVRPVVKVSRHPLHVMQDRAVDEHNTHAIKYARAQNRLKMFSLSIKEVWTAHRPDLVIPKNEDNESPKGSPKPKGKGRRGRGNKSPKIAKKQVTNVATALKRRFDIASIAAGHHQVQSVSVERSFEPAIVSPLDKLRRGVRAVKLANKLRKANKLKEAELLEATVEPKLWSIRQRGVLEIENKRVVFCVMKGKPNSVYASYIRITIFDASHRNNNASDLDWWEYRVPEYVTKHLAKILSCDWRKAIIQRLRFSYAPEKNHQAYKGAIMIDETIPELVPNVFHTSGYKHMHNLVPGTMVLGVAEHIKSGIKLERPGRISAHDATQLQYEFKYPQLAVVFFERNSKRSSTNSVLVNLCECLEIPLKHPYCGAWDTTMDNAPSSKEEMIESDIVTTIAPYIKRTVMSLVKSWKPCSVMLLGNAETMLDAEPTAKGHRRWLWIRNRNGFRQLKVYYLQQVDYAIPAVPYGVSLPACLPNTTTPWPRRYSYHSETPVTWIRKISGEDYMGIMGAKFGSGPNEAQTYTILMNNQDFKDVLPRRISKTKVLEEIALAEKEAKAAKEEVVKYGKVKALNDATMKAKKAYLALNKAELEEKRKVRRGGKQLGGQTKQEWIDRATDATCIGSWLDVETGERWEKLQSMGSGQEGSLLFYHVKSDLQEEAGVSQLEGELAGIGYRWDPPEGWFEEVGDATAIAEIEEAVVATERESVIQSTRTGNTRNNTLRSGATMRSGSINFGQSGRKSTQRIKKRRRRRKKKKKKKKKKGKSTHRSGRSTDRKDNKTTGRSIDRKTNKTTGRSTDRKTSKTTGRSIDRKTNKTTGRSTGRKTNKTTGRSTDRKTHKTTGRSVDSKATDSFSDPFSSSSSSSSSEYSYTEYTADETEKLDATGLGRDLAQKLPTNEMFMAEIARRLGMALPKIPLPIHSAFYEGQRVQARYGGGTQWWAATIATLHPDASMDLVYDLPDMAEFRVEPELIRLPGWDMQYADKTVEEVLGPRPPRPGEISAMPKRPSTRPMTKHGFPGLDPSAVEAAQKESIMGAGAITTVKSGYTNTTAPSKISHSQQLAHTLPLSDNAPRLDGQRLHMRNWRLMKQGTKKSLKGFITRLSIGRTTGPHHSSHVNKPSDPSMPGMYDPAEDEYQYDPEVYKPVVELIKDISKDTQRYALAKARAEGRAIEEEPNMAEASSRAAAVRDELKEWTKNCFMAVRNSQLAQVEEYIDYGVLPQDARDDYGNTLLHIACQQGLKAITKLLLRRGADINAKNTQGNTSLHYCFAYGFKPLGEYLITKGANDLLQNAAGVTCYEGIDTSVIDNL